MRSAKINLVVQAFLFLVILNISGLQAAVNAVFGGLVVLLLISAIVELINGVD